MDLDIQDLVHVTASLDRVCQELGGPGQTATATTKLGTSSDKDVSQLGEECRRVSSQLLRVLASIELPGDARRRKQDALKAAFRLRWKEGEIQSLQPRLKLFRSQLNLHLLVSHSVRAPNSITLGVVAPLLRLPGLRHYSNMEVPSNLVCQSAEQQESTLQKLGIVGSHITRPLEHHTIRLGLRRISGRRGSVSQGTHQLPTDRPGEGYTGGACRFRSEHCARLPPLGSQSPYARGSDSRHLSLRRNGKPSSSHRSGPPVDVPMGFRRRLPPWRHEVVAFSGMARIERPDILDHGQGRVREIDADEVHIRRNHHCRELQRVAMLSIPRQVGRLLVSRRRFFYFWNSGIDLQMTQMGLFRSLLHQILSQRRDIIPLVAPKRWECLSLLDHALETTERDLRDMLHAAVAALAVDSKVCLFIDGLDEFDGDHEHLVRLFHDLVQANQHLKVCVASRPWLVFQDAFHRRPNLRLEDLTHADIKHFVSSRLLADAEFAKLRQRETVFSGPADREHHVEGVGRVPLGPSGGGLVDLGNVLL